MPNFVQATKIQSTSLDKFGQVQTNFVIFFKTYLESSLDNGQIDTIDRNVISGNILVLTCLDKFGQVETNFVIYSKTYLESSSNNGQIDAINWNMITRNTLAGCFTPWIDSNMAGNMPGGNSVTVLLNFDLKNSKK